MSSEFWTRDVLQGSFSAAYKTFIAWYQQEFFSLFPPRIRAWLTDRGDRQLILKAGERDLWCLDGHGNRSWRLPFDEIATSSLEEALSRRGLPRNAVRIGLEMDADAFFVRKFEIPSVALSNLPKVLVADIERKTPFNIADVLYGHTATRNPNAQDKTLISLWILRRNLAQQATEQAGLEIADLAFIQPRNDGDPAEATPVLELKSRTEDSNRFRNLVLGLCAATLLLAVIGVAVTLRRQATANDELDAKIQEMTARAARVRQIVDKASSESRLLSVLRSSRHDEPLFADLWEETARIIPDSAFVTDMRLSETKPNDRVLDIVGFASSAVGLPALFNKSPLFFDASLTAPITPDPNEKREGFSLQAKIERKKPESGN